MAQRNAAPSADSNGAWADTIAQQNPKRAQGVYVDVRQKAHRPRQQRRGTYAKQRVPMDIQAMRKLVREIGDELWPMLPRPPERDEEE